MSREAFFCEFDVSGGITKKIASAAVYGVDYSHQIKTPPTITLEGAGYIRPGFGQMALINNPAKPESVFSNADQTFPPEHKPYPVRCMWGLQGKNLFEGSAVMRKLGRPILMELAVSEFETEALAMIDTETARPMAFGVVSHQIPHKLTGSTLSNPYFDLTKTIRVYEEGVEIGNNIASDPNEFGTAPTATTINLDSSPTGELSVSGTGLNASTLEAFFQYVSTTLSLSLDLSKAPNADTITINFWVDAQVKLVDLADQVAQAFNYQFYINNGVLYLIDKLNAPTEILVDPSEIRSVGEPPFRFPTQGFDAKWTERVPFSGTDLRLGSKEHHVPARSTKFKFGHQPSYRPFCTSESVIKTQMENKIAFLEKPTPPLAIRGIDLTKTFGDQLKFNHLTEPITMSMKVRRIVYNFAAQLTIFKGECDYSELERGL